MNFLQRIRSICFDIASCYRIGNYTGGHIIASLLAIPLVILSRLILMVAPWQGYIQFFVFLGLSLLMVQLALHDTQAEYQVYGQEEASGKSLIVWNRVVGLVITFIGVTFSFSNFKSILFGFLIFHVLIYMKPILFRYDIFKRLDEWPGALGFMASDVLIGLVANVFVRIFSIL